MSTQARIRIARRTTLGVSAFLAKILGILFVLTGVLSLAASVATPVVATIVLAGLLAVIIPGLHALEERRIRRSPLH